MSNVPKISVIVPVYNSEKFIGETILSILDQTFSDVEIILVDDGSTDGSYGVCKQYADESPNIKLLSGENRGVSAARNKGLDEATGKYVFFMDADDTIDREFFRSSYKVAERNDSDIVVLGDYFFYRLPNPSAFPAWAMLIRKSFLDANKNIRSPEGIQPCEDGLFSHQLLALTDKISANRNAVYHYRQHQAQNHRTINNDGWKVLKDIPKWFEILENFYREKALLPRKAGHLALFLEHEPFGLRYLGMNLDDPQKSFLHGIIKDFFSEKVAPYLKPSDRKHLGSVFLHFLEAENIKEFEDRFVKNMKILIVQHRSFIGGTGGVEKMCCFFANSFAERGHHVEIATMEDVQGSAVYPLDHRVSVKNLFSPPISQMNPKPISKYKGPNLIKLAYSKYQREKAKTHNRNLYKKFGGEKGLFEHNISNRSKAWYDYIMAVSPDIIIVMSPESLLEITFDREYEIPIVVSINGRPDYDYTDILWERRAFLLEHLQNSYKHLAGCQILFDSYRDFLPKSFNGKVFVVPNPVDQVKEEDIAAHRNDKERFILIHVARLDDSCKQQSVAMDVFSNLAKKHPKWDLHFWGVGRDEVVLREKIEKLSLRDRIFLNGFTDNPVEKMKNADVFLFPSKYEGFPLALIEAMSVGLPCIGLEACSGVNELIEHGKNGFLAKDAADMQNLMEKLMLDHELRSRFGKQANKDMQKYDPKIIVDKWEELINSLVK